MSAIWWEDFKTQICWNNINVLNPISASYLTVITEAKRLLVHYSASFVAIRNENNYIFKIVHLRRNDSSTIGLLICAFANNFIVWASQLSVFGLCYAVRCYVLTIKLSTGFAWWYYKANGTVWVRDQGRQVSMIEAVAWFPSGIRVYINMHLWHWIKSKLDKSVGEYYLVEIWLIW